MKINAAVAKILKSYVYIYIDPRNNAPFYIGRGKGNRLFSHLADVTDSEKVARIAKIRRSGKEPQIDILRYGLTDAEASLVEAAAIDLLEKPKITNKVSGYHSSSFGRINSQDLISMLSPKKVTVRHKAILITINKLYRSDMTALELYEATRGIWVVGEARRNKVEYAMAVYQGIVHEVYHVEKWHPAGTLKYRTRDSSGLVESGRWEFSGSIATDIRERYIGFSVGKSGQNPIRYVNV